MQKRPAKVIAFRFPLSPLRNDDELGKRARQRAGRRRGDDAQQFIDAAVGGKLRPMSRAFENGT